MFGTGIQLIKRGWALIGHLSTAQWLLAGLGITLPAAVPVWLGWDSPQSRALTYTLAVAVWAILFLIALAYYGHKASPTTDETPVAERYEPIHKVIAHVAAAIGDRDSAKCFPSALNAIRQAGIDGKLKMRGRRQLQSRDEFKSHFDEAYQDIPSDYWKISTLGPIATDANYRDTGHTMPKSPWDWHPTDFRKAKKQYADIVGRWDDVVNLWPIT